MAQRFSRKEENSFQMSSVSSSDVPLVWGRERCTYRESKWNAPMISPPSQDPQARGVESAYLATP